MMRVGRGLTTWAVSLLVVMAVSGLAYGLSDTRRTFSLVPPQGWKVEMAPDNTADVRLLAPREPGFQANLALRNVSYPNGALDADARSHFREELGKGVPQFKLVAETDEKLGGSPAWRVRYTGKVGQVAVEGFTLLCLKQTRMFIVTFLAAQKRYPALDREVEAALHTFKTL